MKRILKVNRHSAQTICMLSYADFRKEPEVEQKREKAFAAGEDHNLFLPPSYLYQTKTYLYLWVRKPE